MQGLLHSLQLIGHRGHVARCPFYMGGEAYLQDCAKRLNKSGEHLHLLKSESFVPHFLKLCKIKFQDPYHCTFLTRQLRKHIKQLTNSPKENRRKTNQDRMAGQVCSYN